MKTTTTRRRAGRAAAAAALAAVLATGCGAFGGDDSGSDAAPPKEPTPSGTGPYPLPRDATEAAPLPTGATGQPKGGIPSPADVDSSDATAVSKAALTALTTSDTAIDTSRNDAGRRTAEAGWCTTSYAEQLRAAVSRSQPGTDWTTWAEHKAYTRPRLTLTEEAGRPNDTPSTAYRQWTITLTPTGRDGWKGREEVHVAFAELTRATASKPWRLNAVTFQ
ncbi:hypothetical protein OG858_47340 (plasmid) [Streptomyces europaeiscabiei]|uniref:hypothetical protein n=1 Tax=Streptomyces europaeiscabiei TaxID=146819 RepID=UPI002E822726|nr:hypothetical protein [Streptomyces europaeiscabiei]WUD38815.1 hypothetical protein OG858_47340 [Streptomyces europaeiscabiei]